LLEPRTVEAAGLRHHSVTFLAATPLLHATWFARFARKERITDRTLWVAVDRADRGLIDADLRGGVIKQRVARSAIGADLCPVVTVRFRGRHVEQWRLQVWRVARDRDCDSLVS
jgi:hypothetical protein